MPDLFNRSSETAKQTTHTDKVQSDLLSWLEDFAEFETADKNTMFTLMKTDDQKKGKPFVNEIDGRQAWLTLACVFMINATVLGPLKVYGLIFEQMVDQKSYTREEASWPLSMASTVQNFVALLTPLLALKLSWRSIELTQTLLFVLANVGAYFSQNLILDVLLLGVVQGIAFSIRYNMDVMINNEYFSKYRATAMGIDMIGATCGALFLKPLISYALDASKDNFKIIYLVFAVSVASNIPMNFFIRKPRHEEDIVEPIEPITTIKAIETIETPETTETKETIKTIVPSDADEKYPSPDTEHNSKLSLILSIAKNPNFHFFWIMQTIYFYISRTYTIFIVDYGEDKGLNQGESRNIVNFWIYGELIGRLVFGSIIDMNIINLKWSIFIVYVLLALGGFAILGSYCILEVIAGKLIANAIYYWIFGSFVFIEAALASAAGMLMVPFGQDYICKKQVPWLFAAGCTLSSIFLLLRPLLIGLSRDHFGSYDLLIVVMSAIPFIYAFVFVLLEPILKRFNVSEKE